MIVRRLCLAAMLCASCAGAEEVAAVCGESDVMRWDTRGLCGVAPTGVTAHWGGEMSASETWTKDSVHVVYGRVTLPTNVTLTVESGAIVKFVGGGIHALGLLVAEGATFTDFADDSVGGDTDGHRDAVPYTSYVIDGNVQADADTRFRCRDLAYGIAQSGDPDVIAFDTRGLGGEVPLRTVAHAGGELRESETWPVGTVHVVYGTLVVPTNVTLTVASGAVVKFAGGGIYALGQLIADGAIFTDLADDSVGGDTDGDANGVPYTSYFIKGNVEVDAGTQFRCRDLSEQLVQDCGTDAFRFDTRGLLGAVPSGTVAHWGGRLETDETWPADATHVVYGTMTFPTNVTLTVASGAVVKFVGGGILAEGPLVAEGAAFTDLDDDSVGGDTRGDGWTQPFASYSIEGDVRDDAATVYRCLDTHYGYLMDGSSGSLAFDTRGFDASEMDGTREHSGEVTSDETWGADETHVVYGTLSVTAGVTLTIEPGAVVKFVGGGLAVDGLCIARGVTFTDLDDASRGASRTGGKLPYTSYALEGNFETDAATVILCRRGLADGLADAGQSRVFRMETEVAGVRFAGESREITFSTVWDGSSAVEVTETRPDGSTVVLTNGTADCEGVFLWDAGETPGLYTLRHVTDTNELLASFYRLDESTILHEGDQSGTNVWTKGLVHLLSGEVFVPAGAKLVLEEGAIIKFMPGSSLTVKEGGRCVANGVVFTHVRDVEYGGDTLYDGELPIDNDYSISGSVEFDENTVIRYYSDCPVWLAVKDLSFRQRYPWNGLVDIDCKIVCNRPETNINLIADARDNVAGRSLVVRRIWLENDSTHTNAIVVKSGNHRIVWDAVADAPDVCSDDVSISLSLFVGISPYLVVDLSAGKDALFYQVSSLAYNANNNWGDEYKTSKLLLKYVAPGSFIMGSPKDEVGHDWYPDYNCETQHKVTLSKGFYLGVFEVTQKQFALVTGMDPSEDKGEMRPVNRVPYNTIRGSNLGKSWPKDDLVDSGSFMGLLRTKSGLHVDLPTEAQWEYTCRAGTTSALNNGKNLTSTDYCPNLDEIARYYHNVGDGRGGYTARHTKVGSYLPNAWGFYDMHGNMGEWCIDWWEKDLGSAEVVDPVGPDTGTYRVVRGGAWCAEPKGGSAAACRSAYRSYCYSYYDYNSNYPWMNDYFNGFRVACTLNSVVSADASGSVRKMSASGRLDTRIGTRIARESERIAYSPRWGTAEDLVTSCAVSVGGVNLSTSGEEGFVDWMPDAPGVHTLVHTAGEAVMTAQFIVLGDDVLRHTGAIAADETWSAGMVHLVVSDITVLPSATLTIEPGAVVKFMTGTSLTVNGTCTAYGVIFTHVNDDTVGGDTLFDGDKTKPVAGAYVLSGNVYEDEETEERYGAPVVTSGTIAKNTSWRSRNVYHITDNLTIASGATLTIMPGAIVKFDSGKMLTVNSGATLSAIGTRAQPIVFTSIKDDDWGGDTNGDGDATEPQPGDWVKIGVNGGVANFSNVQILYSSKNETTGAINMNGGRVVFNNGIIAHGLYDAFGVESGNCHVTNSVIRDCLVAFRHWTRDPIVNCVIYDCGRLTQGGGQHFVNCVFSEVFETWEAFGFPQNGTTYRNCCFWNESGSVLTGEGRQDALTVCGRNGNIWANPQFLAPDKGDFRIADTSPCVDAGDGSVSPKTDWYGQPRKTYLAAEQTGVPNANGEYADIGIHEIQPRNVKSDIDLAVVRVSAPETLTVGEDVTVSWTVRNEGSEKAVGQWSDRVEIVCANGATVTLGTKTITGGLASDGERMFSGTWTVPSAQVGPAYVRVTANCNWGFFEGSSVANNTASAEGISEVLLPELAGLVSGSSEIVGVAPRGETSFALPAGASEHGGLLVMRSEADVAAWTGAGQVPTADIFFTGAVKVGDNTWIVTVPQGADGYVTVRNDSESAAEVELSLESGAFLLFETGVVTAPNVGTVTLNLYGNGFDADMTAYLEGNGKSVAAADVAVGDAVKAAVTFDVDGLPEGTYRVRLVKGGEEISAEALALTQQKVGPKWFGKMEIASVIRSGRVYTGTFTYGNAGDVALAAPYVVLKASGDTLIRFSEADAWGDTLEFMAVSESAPASLVKPGETRRITFFYKTTGKSVSVTASTTTEDPKAFPWDTNGNYMRPSWATDEIWNRALATLKRNVGATWNDYLDRMRANCDHLQKIGTPTHRIDRLWQLEVNEALGVDHAVSALAGGTDLARSGRGFGLSFSRSYGSGMYQRLRKGILGYGWSDNLSVSCELQENGTRFVIQSGNGSSYGFTKASGSWTPEDARDKTRMSESATEWTLTAQSGMVVKFSKSTKRLVSVRDNMGNGIDFTWDGVATESGVRGAPALPKLVRMTHTDGQWLAFTYEGDLLVSAADDQGRTTSYAYTGEMLTEVTAFNGRKVRYNYLPADDTAASRALRQIVAPDGQTKDFTYDAEGRVATASRNGSHFTSEIVRGELGSYSIIAPNGGVTAVAVGAGGETLATVNALGQKVQRTYTADTLLESVIAPSGKRSKIFYDTNGQAVKSMDAAGAATSFAYTEDFGSLKSVTDARQNAINYGYDKLGRSESVAYPDETSSRIFYAANGDVTSAVNAKGESIAYTYDGEGNKIRAVWPNGRVFAWAYDSKGNCTNASDSVTGAVTMEYDDQEQLTRITYPGNRGFTYAYDEFGRVIERAMFGRDDAPSSSAKACYFYDAFGRIAKMTDGVGNLYVANTYDPVTGNLVLQTYGNGTVVSNAYDLLDRTTGIYHYLADAPRSARLSTGEAAAQRSLEWCADPTPAASVGLSPRDSRIAAFFEYAYNEDGQRISLTTKEGVERYTYDAAGQVVGVVYPDGTEENFAYDAVGNRLAIDEDTYTVNALNQYTSVRSAPRADRDTTFTYDLDGNLTSRTSAADGTTTYAYDCESRLIGVTNTLKGIAWSCEYDVFGNRVKVTDNGVTTEKLYIQGSLPSVAAEYRGDSLVTRHILSGAVRIADISGEADSRPLVKEGDVHYYHADGLASTRLLTDKDGTIVATASYKAFGEIRTSSGIAITDGYVGTLGIERDSTGLLFMRNRYYDAAMGRFVQRDPIGLNGGDFNWYRYCVNRVCNNNDPIGLFTISINCQTLRPIIMGTTTAIGAAGGFLFGVGTVAGGSLVTAPITGGGSLVGGAALAPAAVTAATGAGAAIGVATGIAISDAVCASGLDVNFSIGSISPGTPSGGSNGNPPGGTGGGGGNSNGGQSRGPNGNGENKPIFPEGGKGKGLYDGGEWNGSLI